jgi:hypothetical protein
MKLTMLPGVFYRARQAGQDAFIDGRFYYGRFYQGRHLIGQVDDDGAFRYFEGQDNGRPTFPEHVAGQVDGLLLTLKDGTLFNLVEMDRHSLEAS